MCIELAFQISYIGIRIKQNNKVWTKLHKLQALDKHWNKDSFISCIPD